jgi:hypothetical protein
MRFCRLTTVAASTVLLWGLACGAQNDQKTVTVTPASDAPSTTSVSAPTRSTTHQPATTTTARQLATTTTRPPVTTTTRRPVTTTTQTTQRPSTTTEAPAGATAQCGDGTYSFSQHRSGTCSHHGGVSRWL